MRTVRGGSLIAWVLAAASMAGCDQVFGLASRTPDGGVEACAYTKLAPDQDEDLDGTLNGADLCPGVPFATTHDEDSDGVPDVCDLCPAQLEAGADLDCDGIGAACDPDDTRPHTTQFFGFGATTGLSIEADLVLANDALRFAQVGSDYGRAVVLMPVPSSGQYELHATITGADATYWEMSLFVDGDTGNRYQVGISFVGGAGKLKISNFNAAEIAEAPFGPVGSILNLVLRMELAGTEIRASVGGNEATAELVATAPGLSAPLTYSFGAYRDAPRGTAFHVDFLHLRRIVPVEPTSR